MKFKIDDRIVIVQSEDKDIIGKTGTIIEIDEDWIYPYEVMFDDESLNAPHMETLFADDDLEFVGEGAYETIKSDGTIEPVEPVVLVFDQPSYVNIKWQEGTVDENGVNGVQIEDVIDLLVERLQGFQNGKFPCRENALAITHLQEAQNWLYRRTMVRKKQGIEGQYKNHV